MLRNGGTIVYPTDTVYGLGADVTNESAVQCVRQLKGRAADKPILAMVADLDMLSMYAEVTPLARALTEQFLPGPLTLVLKTTSSELATVAGSEGTAGFRIPNHPFCLELARTFQKPITSTSVNLSGMAQPRDVQTMLSQLDQTTCRVAHVVDHGALSGNTPSTIVDARGTHVVILREGALLRSAFAGLL